jgi:hypothetical protein
MLAEFFKHLKSAARCGTLNRYQVKRSTAAPGNGAPRPMMSEEKKLRLPSKKLHVPRSYGTRDEGLATEGKRLVGRIGHVEGSFKFDCPIGLRYGREGEDRCGEYSRLGENGRTLRPPPVCPLPPGRQPSLKCRKL